MRQHTVTVAGRRARGRAVFCAALTAAGGVVFACTEGSDTGVDPADPLPSEGEPRTFALGWAVTPPRATTESVLETAQAVAEAGEYTLIQQAPPWDKILAGEPMDELVEDPAGLADYMKALGQELVLLVDPLDGLDRRKEPYELVQADRSILEPEIRELHEQWTLRLAQRLRPAYVGLASEINTLGAHGDPVLYAELVDVINTLSPQLRQILPGVKVFVSFQVDDAWNRLLPEAIDHFGMIDDFDIDVFGLSSYPVFAFDTPADIPDDYFSVFQDYTDVPLILVEGGWSSEPTGWGNGTPGEQVDFFNTYERLMDGVDGELWVFLIYADFAVEEWGLPPEREASLSNFARMGIVDTEFRPKPAFAEWDRILRRPWVGAR